MNALDLPWPLRELSPNARVHRMVKAKAAKAYRTSCHWAARAYQLPLPSEGEILLNIEFCPPDNRRRDLDNMLAAAKSGLDGFADAHAVDDHRFALLLRRGPSCKGGKIVVAVAA